ncbi:MAG: zinc ribbon domain-containing protein [Oscillospiraceae bacterium]|jgi:molecular chaperone DnaK (HSP70)|nr:zinc ribbon domain-containing protein [Oscillospiraceae bacterium]
MNSNTYEDTFGSTVKRYFDFAVEKTGDAVDATKNYVEKTRQKNKIAALYEKLGRAYYAAKNGDKFQRDEIPELLSVIEDALDGYNNLCGKEKSVEYCKNCGKSISFDSRFCNHCGGKL